MYVSQETIEQKKDMLEAHWGNTIPVANTHQLYFVLSRGDKYLLVGQTSDSRELSEVRISEDTLDDSIESITSERQDTTSIEECSEISKGDWVVVNYEGSESHGEVMDLGSTASGEVKVNVMRKVGKWWKWPEQEDHIFY